MPMGSRQPPAVPQAGYPRPVTIGCLNESNLHAALKRLVAPAGSRFEVPRNGYVIDALHGDLLIEVQTRNFGAMRTKLAALLPEHKVRLVLPVATTRWLVKHHDDSRTERRRSPKSAHAAHVFSELVYAPQLFAHPNLQIELALLEEEEHRVHAPGKAWRRKGWVVTGRSLVAVHERLLLEHPQQLLKLLPSELPATFRTVDLATLGKWPRRLAQQAAYCLVELELATRVGKEGNAYLYQLSRK